MTNDESRDNPGESGSDRTVDIKRRRRLLFVYGALAVAVVVSVAVVQMLGSSKDEKKRASAVSEPTRPVIVERFKLKPASGERGHGLAELVRKDGVSNLRVLAVGLKPSLVSESYQLVLAGGRGDPTPLGNQTVGQKGTFLGQAKISVDAVHEFRRIELRRITEGTPYDDRLVLRGAIPG